jgi:hypothetical protein
MKSIKWIIIFSGFIQVAFGQGITVFESPNFQGRSKTLDEGEYRFLTPTDFNDIISSVKVSAGYTVNLYEQADEAGGFGIMVDLLENCPNLTTYNFNDITSFIVVSKINNRPGYVWVRGTVKNGQYLPAHWERQMAGGGPTNSSVATVSPPTQSKLIGNLLFLPKVLKNKSTQKVLDVKSNSNVAGAGIVQAVGNGTFTQAVKFADAGNGLFNILTKFNLYLSLKFNAVVSTGGSGSLSDTRILIQDNKYNATPVCNISATANCPQHQAWKLTPVPNEPFTYIIESVAFTNMVLQTSTTDPSVILISNNTGADNQKWIIADPEDLILTTLAMPADLAEYKDIMANQNGVAVLSGETTKPFYYHHNQRDEMVYKYDKIIDISRLPEAFISKLQGYLGKLGVVLTPVKGAIDVVLDIKDWIVGRNATQFDCWYPDSEFKKTLCGNLKEDAYICPQDFLHTEVTIDKDINLPINPNDKFKPMLKSRWAGDTFDEVEGEVKPVLLKNVSSNGSVQETTTPKNPLFLTLKKNDALCVFGPWMTDILDINAKVPIPLTDKKIEVANIDIRNHNEIHPVNQMWYKKEREIDLIAVVDGTGYFEKTGNGEIQASGLNQRMRFSVAFEIPTAVLNADPSSKIEMLINGVGVDFTDNPQLDVQEVVISLKHKGIERLKIRDNSFVKLAKTHTISLDKVRKRADGSIQGFIIVETEPITNRGGSINITIN